jgi:hypothetical protein
VLHPFATLDLRTLCLGVSLLGPGFGAELVLIEPTFPRLVHGVPRPFTSLRHMQEAPKKRSSNTQNSILINLTLGIIETNIPQSNFSVTKPDPYVLETSEIGPLVLLMLISFE